MTKYKISNILSCNNLFMRFRKRIKIAKGISLNFSKSGLSTTFGMKGLSFNVGTKGAYVNYGIPGTGLYDRKKLSSGSPVLTKSSNSLTKSAGKESKSQSDVSQDLQLRMNELGDVQVFDSESRLIEDKEFLRKLMKTPQYSEKIKFLKQEIIAKIHKLNDQFINIYQLTPKLETEEEWINEYKNLSPAVYMKKEFSVPELPSIEESISQIEERAKKEVKGILFWKNESKRQEFVNANLELLRQERAKWEAEKILFQEEESKRKNKIDEENKAIEKRKWEIENCILTGKSDYVNSQMEKILSTLELPVDFSVDFNFKEPDIIEVDLDLPEIEDLPNKKANLLSSGKLSVKEKTKKQILQDYATCVHGLAFFLAGLFFNISPKVSQINIAGYTQRLDPKTGNTKDTYIYYIEFEREIFSKLSISQINPIDAFENFSYKRNILKSLEMKEVEITS
ncbi:DUF4236 domain-containing protein [Methanosarcina sp. UBA289]|uniref:DUF4236 domain-containing protein n=1 Tax=Methanosarcina sp. UBA289 TaxID=1915574 RepID=UPI0025FD395B|nr:DUF4236 domain-containing protein [Methanosarcina sp. UBA289]